MSSSHSSPPSTTTHFQIEQILDLRGRTYVVVTALDDAPFGVQPRRKNRSKIPRAGIPLIGGSRSMA